MKKETGDSAFPWQEVLIDGNGNSWSNQREGMTLRDYFAGKAMAALISGAMADGSPFADEDGKIVSKYAFFIADAMLKARGE